MKLQLSPPTKFFGGTSGRKVGEENDEDDIVTISVEDIIQEEIESIKRLEEVELQVII